MCRAIVSRKFLSARIRILVLAVAALGASAARADWTISAGWSTGVGSISGGEGETFKVPSFDPTDDILSSWGFYVGNNNNSTSTSFDLVIAHYNNPGIGSAIYTSSPFTLFPGQGGSGNPVFANFTNIGVTLNPLSTYVAYTVPTSGNSGFTYGAPNSYADGVYTYNGGNSVNGAYDLGFSANLTAPEPSVLGIMIPATILLLRRRASRHAALRAARQSI